MREDGCAYVRALPDRYGRPISIVQVAIAESRPKPHREVLHLARMARRARAVCWHGFVQHSGATGAPVKGTGRQHDAEPRRYPTFAAFAEQHHTFDSARTRHEVFDPRL